MYTLIVNNGTYTEDTLFRLFVTVIKHRFHHFCNGEGWTD